MVSPILQFVALSKDGKYLTLKDATGVYNSVTNPGGYGGDNASAPTVIGFRVRYWSDTGIYGNMVSDDSAVISALQGDGKAFTTQDFGGPTISQFSPGVHQISFYPFESQTTEVNITNASTLVTWTSGTAPNAWNSAYLGVIFQDPDNGSYSKVYYIDRSLAVTSTQFYLTEKFEGESKEGYNVLIAPEGDLKVLITVPAKECLVKEIGKMGNCECDKEKTDTLTYMVMQLYAADVNFSCKDYNGAHNKVLGVYLECNNCKPICGCN